MEVTAFDKGILLSDRERALSQLVLQLALHEEVQDDLTNYLGMSNDQLYQLKSAVAVYERELAKKNPTLTQMLGNVVKSKCCT